MTPRLEFTWTEDRFFDGDPDHKSFAHRLFSNATQLPLLSPRVNVDARILADPEGFLGNPASLIVQSDNQVLRMLYAQGVPLERLGIKRRDGEPVETDPRRIWYTFAEYAPTFWGTSPGIWLKYILQNAFGVRVALSPDTADEIFDHISDLLESSDFRARSFLERSGVGTLCISENPIDKLESYRVIRDSGWRVRVLPVFRMDTLVALDSPGWRESVRTLGSLVGREIRNYTDFARAVEDRRLYFRAAGCRSTDLSVMTPFSTELSSRDMDSIFQRALGGSATADDTIRFTAHMLMESARMSIDDGLTMQLRVGIFRNHNRTAYERFGPERGADIPVQHEFTRNMYALLNKYGNDRRLALVISTLDETTLARELAPIAGHYPTVYLDSPWWSFLSLNGVQRYLDYVVETAGLYKLAGFSDNSRSLVAIPARHDMWRRAAANWITRLVMRGIVDDADADAMMRALAHDLAARVYRIERNTGALR